PITVRGSFQGTAKAFQAALSHQPLFIVSALVAVYLVLGILYESLVHPLTILSTLPSAGVGALLALLATGTDFTIIALIGVILLIGIVKKNAIMMIDFALQIERERELSSREAIYQACLLRLRPILMTTMAAMFGALPLAIGFGEGAELRRPLGIAVVGGLLPLLALGATGGCQYLPVGPVYHRPSVEVPPAYKEGTDWKPAEPQDLTPRGDWWHLYGDPDLDALERQVQLSNQNVLLAAARYEQALALLGSARSGYFPTITADVSST